MNDTGFVALRNGQCLPRARVPQLSLADFQGTIRDGVAGGQRVAALFGDVPDSTREWDYFLWCCLRPCDAT